VCVRVRMRVCFVDVFHIKAGSGHKQTFNTDTDYSNNRNVMEHTCEQLVMFAALALLVERAAILTQHHLAFHACMFSALEVSGEDKSEHMGRIS